MAAQMLKCYKLVALAKFHSGTDIKNTVQHQTQHVENGFQSYDLPETKQVSTK